MSAPDLVPTELRRLRFARALYLSGRIREPRGPVVVCAGCHRPWPLDPLTYAFAVDVVGWAEPRAPYLFLRHAPCGTLQAIPRATGGR